ncbi:E3 ubiquitin-protein ligase RMND5A [Episyrphus balteatus]|uniref:E3 ubiquitin-protein ligase RMND5A n=1 Tax=Episyrphus balteatus TaxID=286459 RepID=UPI0024852FFD|nr:E3 ubiquitin-protein ligase RMND5A [Episyrphus balteatus]
MDACLAVEKELNRVITKFTGIREYSGLVITDVVQLLSEIQNAFNEDNQNDAVLTESQVRIITDALHKTNEKLQRISAEHRELHGAVSKVGKVVDKNFVSDFTATTRTDALQDEQNMMLLNKVMAKHYCRQGMDEVAQALIKESGMQSEVAQEVFDSESSFAEIFKIWKSIQKYNLQPALEWSARYSNELLEKNSSLEFKLHKLAFLQIVSRGIEAQGEAIAYARNNFSKFVDRFGSEIPNLMGTFIYLPNGIENSPYKHLISPEMWTEASYIFLKDACHTLGISKNSALSVVINAGCTALPALLNIKQVMLSRQVLSIWSGRDELPIEIDLDPEYRYHSIFACPILRQQTSEDNPPKKLTCGHVISSDALLKLSNGPILKCPYCPVEQNSDDAVRIWF